MKWSALRFDWMLHSVYQKKNERMNSMMILRRNSYNKIYVLKRKKLQFQEVKWQALGIVDMVQSGRGVARLEIHIITWALRASKLLHTQSGTWATSSFLPSNIHVNLVIKIADLKEPIRKKTNGAFPNDNDKTHPNLSRMSPLKHSSHILSSSMCSSSAEIPIYKPTVYLSLK